MTDGQTNGQSIKCRSRFAPQSLLCILLAVYAEPAREAEFDRSSISSWSLMSGNNERERSSTPSQVFHNNVRVYVREWDGKRERVRERKSVRGKERGGVCLMCEWVYAFVCQMTECVLCLCCIVYVCFSKKITKQKGSCWKLLFQIYILVILKYPT